MADYQGGCAPAKGIRSRGIGYQSAAERKATEYRHVLLGPGGVEKSKFLTPTKAQENNALLRGSGYSWVRRDK